MYTIAQDLLDALRATPETLRSLLRGVGHAQAAAARGGDEQWSVVEVLCHLRDAEAFGLARNRLMRDEDDPPIAAYDQDRLAVERDYAAATLPEALEAFLQLRQTHVQELAALPPEAWERTGRHAEQGAITISTHTLHLVSHDAIHLAQIARQLHQLD